MVKTARFIINKRFVGEPKTSDFQYVEEELPPIKDGEYLCEALYLSVDPYMRATDVSKVFGRQMVGSQVAKVLESKHPGYKVGDIVMGYFGWQTRTVQHGDKTSPTNDAMPYVLPDLGGLSPSLGLGVLGMPGNTAYFGLLELCQPKEGETVVVNAAAGAVGMHVGQIAKIKGCRVVGFAGSDAKCNWLMEDIGFDVVYNYKKVDIAKALKEGAPKGVDCYFDNVGGEMSTIVMEHMNSFGRTAVCGAITSYNATEKTMAPIVQKSMIYQNLRMEGFIVYRWADRWLEGIMQNAEWIREGKLKYRETVTEGFKNMPEAFISMLRGENFGKAVVKV